MGLKVDMDTNQISNIKEKGKKERKKKHGVEEVNNNTNNKME